ncbi:MAG TPA: NAD(P)-dependent alcohol dehydrogenase [Novosphingobium sp.]|nr:NAD(P)-dependent alcohol dehydrogenase [Novosphingobium sp.]
MKVQILAKSGDGVRLVVEERPSPVPGPGEVRIRVRAASLNYRDLLFRQMPSMLGRIPVSDGAGEIAAVGPGANRWQVGDRVMAMFMPEWTSGPFLRRYGAYAFGNDKLDGMLAQEVIVPETALVRVPSHLSFEEASTLPCAGVTAWHGLVERGGLGPDHTVLAQGTGGVAIFGLQIAKAIGARCIITSSSDAKLDRARQLGADVGINYAEHADWHVKVLEATNGLGASHILELGGQDTYEKSIQALAGDGKIIQIGLLSGPGSPRLAGLVSVNGDIHAIMVGSGTHLEDLSGFMEQHLIHPVVDSTFPFEEAEAAHDHLRSGKHFGKVVITL